MAGPLAMVCTSLCSTAVQALEAAARGMSAFTVLITTYPSCCTAGLIIVAISNFLFILFTGGHDLNQTTNNIQSPDIKGVDV